MLIPIKNVLHWFLFLCDNLPCPTHIRQRKTRTPPHCLGPSLGRITIRFVTLWIIQVSIKNNTTHFHKLLPNGSLNEQKLEKPKKLTKQHYFSISLSRPLYGHD